MALLDGHELVNNELSGRPATVGWCPLAQLAVVHGRKKDGSTDAFGVSGYVHKDVFLILERRTESLW